MLQGFGSVFFQLGVGGFLLYFGLVFVYFVVVNLFVGIELENFLLFLVCHKYAFIF